MSTSSPRLNTLGRYRIIADLGHGGMGDVYLAVASGPSGFSKLCVLKVLRREMEAESVAAFLDEARLSARLNHPNVVQTYEVLQEGHRHVLVMEYLEGQSLYHVLRRARTGLHSGPDLAMMVRILVDALEGLHYAHELRDFDGSPLGLVHRDFSPHNVFVTYEGQVKLLDFGIAKAAIQSMHTTDGILKGKIRYMAPEQALGRAPLDRRADIFSAGVLLWELLAGQRLWDGLSDVQIVQELAAGRVPPPSTVHQVDGYLEQVVVRATSPDPTQRFPDARSMQHALEAYLRSHHEETGTRRLGSMLSQMFSTERATLQRTIEQQLRMASVLPGNDYSIVISETVPAAPPLRTGEGSASLQPLSEGSTGSSSTSGASPAFRRWHLYALVVLTLCLGGAASFFALRVSRMHEGAATAPVHTAPASVRVAVRAIPPIAHLFLDGAEVDNPLLRDLPIGGRHVLRAEAEGFHPRQTELVLRGDVSWEWVLTPIASVASAAVPPPSTMPTAGPPIEPIRTRPPRLLPRPPSTPNVPSTSTHPTATTEPQNIGSAHNPRPSCANPFYIDDRGIKTIRPECR